MTGSRVTSKGVKLLVVGLLAASAILSSLPASAHSERESEEPAADTQVGKVPTEVRITFTETPSPNAKVTIRDGCNEDVAGATSADGHTLVVALEGGEPGGWSVSYTVISAEDGHESEDDYSFLVQGKPDCSTDGGNDNGGGDDGADDEGAAASDGPASDEPEDDSSDSGVPIGLIIGGTVGVILIAFLIRRATAPRE